MYKEEHLQSPEIDLQRPASDALDEDASLLMKDCTCTYVYGIHATLGLSSSLILIYCPGNETSFHLNAGR